MPKTVTTLTLNPTIDKSCSVQKIEPEEKLRCSQPSLEPGGGGINVARAIARLGGTTTALWTRGGLMGELLGTLLDDEKLDNAPLPISGMTRESFIVYEECSGQQYRFGTPGPTFTSADIDAVTGMISSLDDDVDFVVLSGALPPGAPVDLYRQLSLCAPKQARIVLDTSGDALVQGLSERLFLVKPNMRELGQLAGRDITKEEQVKAVSRELIAEGKTEVVLTSMGSSGVMLVTAILAKRIPAPQVKIRSKVGAGDSTVAGVVHGLARGLPIQEAARLGVAAGSAAVMTAGTELCRAEDVEDLLAAMSPSISL